MRFFAQAREATGCREADLGGETVEAVLGAATAKFGPGLAAVMETSTIWLNGERVEPSQAVGAGDEIAVLPPVSGG